MNIRTLTHEQVKGFKPHKACELFPDLLEGEYLHLRKDIKNNGIKQPITAIEREKFTEIIDGRHRWKIALELELDKIPFRFIPRNTTDTKVWMSAIDMNTSRRHMDKSQRAMVAARISLTSPPGRPSKAMKEDEGFMSTNTAANYLRVSSTSVRQAKEVLRSKNKELIKLVVEGKKHVSDAEVLHKNYAENIVKSAIKEAKKELTMDTKERTLKKIADDLIKEADTTPKEEVLKESFDGQSVGQISMLLKEYDEEWELRSFSGKKDEEGFKFSLTFKDKT